MHYTCKTYSVKLHKEIIMKKFWNFLWRFMFKKREKIDTRVCTKWWKHHTKIFHIALSTMSVFSLALLAMIIYWLRNWQWLRNLIACLHLRPNLYHRFIFNLDHAKLFVKTNIIIYRLFDFLIFFFFTKAWHARKTRCFMMKSFNHCLKRKNDYLVLCQQIYNH